jgi:hypothetical protein
MEDDEKKKSAFARQKIYVSKRKLLGHNPAAIMESELANSTHVGKKYYENTLHIVRGD